MRFVFQFILMGVVAVTATGRAAAVAAQPAPPSFKIAKLKYGGGGDWYANPTAVPNLLKFVRQNTRINIQLEEEVVEPGSAQIFQYPMVYMTGHGNVVFTDQQAQNLRAYLEAGGFLVADDNYGMQEYIRRELKKIFPEQQLTELPHSHPVFRQHYTFESGLPKIHAHDNKPAQAYGIFLDGRLAVLLTYEADLGDGWEDPAVHNDPPEVRKKALRMGTNLLQYALMH